jgi:hypothetical protein
MQELAGHNSFKPIFYDINAGINAEMQPSNHIVNKQVEGLKQLQQELCQILKIQRPDKLVARKTDAGGARLCIL